MQTMFWLSTEVTKVRRNLFNQKIVSPSKKAKLPRSQSVSAVEGLKLKRKRSHESEGKGINYFKFKPFAIGFKPSLLFRYVWAMEVFFPHWTSISIKRIFLFFREAQTSNKESVWNTASQARVQSFSVPSKNGKVCATTVKPIETYWLTIYITYHKLYVPKIWILISLLIPNEFSVCVFYHPLSLPENGIETE